MLINQVRQAKDIIKNPQRNVFKYDAPWWVTPPEKIVFDSFTDFAIAAEEYCRERFWREP